MRELKFRGKRIDNGEWIIGFYYHSTINGRDYIADLAETKSEEVAPETVGQFTGLKDKNGKEICEGDIVTFTNGCISKGVVVFDEECCQFSVRTKIYPSLTNLSFYTAYCEAEIIGNTYDNPELLEAVKCMN